MRAFALLRLTAPFGAIALSACAPRQFPTIPTPEPAPPALTEPPIDWHLRDAEADRVPGISLLKAERELLAGKQPRRVVVVAIIDGGVDTAHADLRSQMWANPRETPGNGRDDDGNGFADDVRGWNLIGGKDGRNVNEDTFEVTRLAAQCERPAGGGRDSLPADLRARCADIEAAYQKKRVEVEGTLQSITNIEQLYLQILPYLRRAAGIGVGDTLTLAQVRAIAPANDTLRQSKNLFLQLAAQDLTQEEVADARKAYTSQAQYGYNKTFDPRPIVGDSYPDTTIKRYGNADVTGPDATHGTHVAGIVAALKNANDSTGGGIAQNARIMALRAVPDGDERDKDIALAIRYAADNGAHIINMSFGKSYSPHKKFVDEAVKYADAKGVLMVHAAGNDGANAAEKPSFPTPFYIEGGRARNWIEVGATSWHAKDSLVATFSNYGKPTVDVFAPGDDIQSTIPGGGFKKQSGTSMASPVVAGLAALLMSYYPAFTAEDVKRIILESSTKLGDQMVYRPGDATGGPAPVRFGDLSATGGIVNAYNAIKMAEQLSGARP